MTHMNSSPCPVKTRKGATRREQKQKQKQNDLLEKEPGQQWSQEQRACDRRLVSSVAASVLTSAAFVATGMHTCERAASARDATLPRLLMSWMVRTALSSLTNASLSIAMPAESYPRYSRRLRPFTRVLTMKLRSRSTRWFK